MHFRITGDINEESGIGSIIDLLSGPTRLHFVPKDYGTGVLGICVVLMCRSPHLIFKRRVRFAKKKKILYLDIMLDLKQMQNVRSEDRKREVLERISNEVPVVLGKYAFQDFDEKQFLADLKSWLDEKKTSDTARVPVE